TQHAVGEPARLSHGPDRQAAAPARARVPHAHAARGRRPAERLAPGSLLRSQPLHALRRRLQLQPLLRRSARPRAGDHTGLVREGPEPVLIIASTTSRRPRARWPLPPGAVVWSP